MSNRRIPFHRFFPVLSAQLGMGASVLRLSPLAQIIGPEVLCHIRGGGGHAHY